MKSLTVLSILSFIMVILTAIVNANNSTWGYVPAYGRFLGRDFVKKPGIRFLTQRAQVVYPPKGHINYINITGIRAWDWGGRKEFGYVTLIKGGPGHRNATLLLRSQSGKGLNFTIEYFGSFN